MVQVTGLGGRLSTPSGHTPAQPTWGADAPKPDLGSVSAQGRHWISWIPIKRISKCFTSGDLLCWYDLKERGATDREGD